MGIVALWMAFTVAMTIIIGITGYEYLRSDAFEDFLNFLRDREQRKMSHELELEKIKMKYLESPIEERK